MHFNYSGNFQDFYFLITFCHIRSYQNSLGFGQTLHKTQTTKITHKVTAHFQHKDSAGYSQENIAQVVEIVPYLLPFFF